MDIPITTTFTIEGYRIKQYLGVVSYVGCARTPR